MSRDKYGVAQDPHCYPGTSTLINRLGLVVDDELEEAERELTVIAANEIEFTPPPYSLAYLQSLHRHLFQDIYDWAGEIRTVDIAKDDTRFCNVTRIEAEAEKVFSRLAQDGWLEHCERADLIPAVAEYYGDINMLHPFREGNGRAQRLMFEHLIINAGYQISWWEVEPEDWRLGNIDAVACNYGRLESIFDRCIGQPIQ
ncbi:putative adenosine monophosphate-protein transferase Fic [Alloalcanivorax gelatiniphagus]|uniref:protein adenylyltransferase n=1 Tax=Alloalcanivorax gelatiniphagus TaxID=1194167 RepID=A0ABY2XP90_9GAMM|nr:putative adenosine monophosphate-protein transferase Fic [Alloalcanivorax gelatiniphagus]TMW13729.1 putative adenosine monophosphate-protein transferase Fic [Alloalcanivorax gelatiniphagus]